MLPSRRSVVVLAALLATAPGLAGCSGDDDASPGGTPAATVSPTAVGDRSQVEVVEAGAEPRRVLALELEAGTTTSSSLAAVQQVVTEQQPTTVPPITVPVDVTVDEAEGDRQAVTLGYGEPTVDGTGLRPADVRQVEQGVGQLTGTSSTLVVRRDGTTVESSNEVDAAGQVDAQLRQLVPVLPTTEVGVGASWTARTVVEIDGATVDEVATYTLDALDGDAYTISVTIDQTYRAGVVGDVEVRGGSGTVDVRLDGSLGRLLPDTASADLATQVTYVIGGRATRVRTTISTDLTPAS